MTDQLQQRIAHLAADRESGASEILDEALDILRQAVAGGVPLLQVARGLVRAQPSMASIWNVALEALAGDRSAERLERYAARVARAPAAAARFGAALFADDPARPLRVVTVSYSRTTAIVLEAIAGIRRVEVACAEGRPVLEGRRLASRLASRGLAVTFFTDGAIGHALTAADAVIVGADAVAPHWVLNKSGTRQLAAAASQLGVATYVVATRDKFVTEELAAHLVPREGAPAEVWEAPPPGVVVRNPYFERCPLDLISSFITDAGIVGPEAVSVVAVKYDLNTLISSA